MRHSPVSISCSCSCPPGCCCWGSTVKHLPCSTSTVIGQVNAYRSERKRLRGWSWCFPLSALQSSRILPLAEMHQRAMTSIYSSSTCKQSWLTPLSNRRCHHRVLELLLCYDVFFAANVEKARPRVWFTAAWQRHGHARRWFCARSSRFSGIGVKGKTL